MKQAVYEIIDNRQLTGSVFRLDLAGDTSAITRPGQFVDISLPGLFLRRPISVCDWDESTLTLIYKVVGQGTAQLAGLQPGRGLDILSGLGNGYDLSKSGPTPLLIGGGVGVPPLVGLARRLRDLGRRPQVLLGFNTREEVFGREEFAALGMEPLLVTRDGSLGEQGLVTDLMPDFTYSYIYTCGPLPMLRAVDRAARTSGQFSFEERMGCGFGACMGCSCRTKNGNKRICKDGPVLEREEIIW